MNLNKWSRPFILAWLVLGSNVAMAQNPPQAVPLTRAGVEGVWLPLPDARLALQARTEAPALHERLQLLRESLTLATAELELLRRAVTLGQDRERALDEAVTSAVAARLTAEAAQRVAEADRDAWWRHPGFWGSLGLIVGGVLVAIVAACVD